MLNFTKNQTLVLEIFFNQPDKEFYMREIARMLDKQPGVFQRDINKLTAEGILKSRYQANARYFSLNNKYPLFSELKSIFFKTVGILGTLRREFAYMKGVKEAYIYGSFAQGNETGASDIDVIIIGSVKENVVIDRISTLEKKFHREINYVLMTENEFRQKTKADNSFLKNIMAKKRIRLV
jgi:predicted nucleotidyltransferase